MKSVWLIKNNFAEGLLIFLWILNDSMKEKEKYSGLLVCTSVKQITVLHRYRLNN